MSGYTQVPPPEPPTDYQPLMEDHAQATSQAAPLWTDYVPPPDPPPFPPIGEPPPVDQGGPNAQLIGGSYADATDEANALGQAQAIANGGIRVQLDGAYWLTNIGNCNFVTVQSMADVAAKIQAANDATPDQGYMTITYDTSKRRFVVTNTRTSGSASTIGTAVAPSSGTDMSGLLKLDAANATTVPGID